MRAGTLSPLGQSVGFHVQTLASNIKASMTEITPEIDKLEKERRANVRKRRSEY